MKTPHALTLLVLLVPLQATAQDIPDPVSYSVSYTYDETSRLTGADIVDQLSIVYEYDASGRLLSSLHTAFSGVSVQPGDSSLPKEFALYDAYPNPFNPVTTVNFDLPRPAKVEIAVFDMLGRRVALLMNGEQEAGRYNVQWTAAGFASGVYVIQMLASTQRFSKAVMLLK